MKLFFVTVFLYLLYSNFVEYPLISYGLIALFAGPLFDWGLFSLIFTCIILFKLRYRWEREGLEFASKLALLVLTTAPYLVLSTRQSSYGYTFDNGVGLQSMDTHRTSSLFHCSLKLMNIYAFSISFHCLYCIYSVL